MPRKSPRRRPPLRCGPKTGAAAIAFGLQIAIEAAMLAELEQQRRSHMASIGTFKKSGHARLRWGLLVKCETAEARQYS
jgi:hypothetical protein